MSKRSNITNKTKVSAVTVKMIRGELKETEKKINSDSRVEKELNEKKSLCVRRS